MKILFTTGHSYPPEAFGGAQASTAALAKRSVAGGHDARVLAGLSGEGKFGLISRLKLKLTRSAVVTDLINGHPVMRAWFPSQVADDVLSRFKPDVVIVESDQAVPIGKPYADAGIPVVVYLRNVEFDELGGSLSELSGATFVGNSSFTAGVYEKEFGIECAAIPPTVPFDDYNFNTTREKVTFINPHPEKGYALALEVARICPDIPFLFVESWKLADAMLENVLHDVSTLPNVTFQRRTGDMARVYGVTGILLAPSQWEEAWGRVASEAHCSGIPVLGSNRGGLPEAIGPGGIVLPYDAPAEAWATQLKKLWQNKAVYDAMSSAALDYAKRPEMDPAVQHQKFMDVLSKAII